jgi:hypothetical protein
MVVRPKIASGFLVQRAVVPLLIFPTSLTDPSRRRGTGGKIFGEREIIQLFANDNPDFQCRRRGRLKDDLPPIATAIY